MKVARKIIKTCITVEKRRINCNKYRSKEKQKTGKGIERIQRENNT